MKEREELELILKLIGKYNLPLSPILEFAIKEKIGEVSEEEVSTNNNEDIKEYNNIKDIRPEGDKADSSDELKIVDYGERTIAVVGNTKPHKEALKTLGGYFVFKTQWGPAWVFRDKKRKIVQAYVDGDASVLKSVEEKQNKDVSRYIIRVEYPDGRIMDSKLVWETLVDVVKYAGPDNVRQLNIMCMGDNLVSPHLNDNSKYRLAQKEVDGGLYVCTYSSTDTKYSQIVRINLGCNLRLKVDMVYIDENGEQHMDINYKKSTLNNQAAGTRDYSKYSFEGSPYYSKRRFVFEVVKHYVETHPRISYESLLRVFPSSLHANKTNGVIRKYDDVLKQELYNPDIRLRFFMKPNEIIELANGIKIVVHNQWGENFGNFLDVVKNIYAVESSTGEVLSESAIIQAKKQNGDIVDDIRIGSVVKLWPSQLQGKIVKTKVNRRGKKLLVIKTTHGDLVEIDDLPFLYEVIKRSDKVSDN